MSLLIDPRVGSVDLLPHIRKFGVPCATEPLDYGDFVFSGPGPDGSLRTYAFERKRLGDMIQSMRDGRLSGHQLIGLLDTYHSVSVIVEGIYRPGPDGLLEELRGRDWQPTKGRVMYREIDAFLTTLNQLCGVSVLRSTSAYETAVMLCTRYIWAQKPWESHRGHLAIHDNLPAWQRVQQGLLRSNVKLERTPLLRKLANQLDGIGWERSGAVAKHFGSAKEMVLADAKEWQKIEGVGKGIATKVVAQLTDVPK